MGRPSHPWLSRWLESAFGIRPREFQRVQAFFLFFVGIGMFYTVGVTVGDTLFLSNLPPDRIPTTLPWVYVGIAVSGFAAVMLYDAVQIRLPRHLTIAGTQLVLALSLLGFRWLVDLDAEWLYFLLMVWLEVAALLSITVFFSFAGDYFSSRDARRLYPFIVGGMALGTLIAGYATSVVVLFIGPRNLLFVCVGLLVMNAGIARFISRRTTPLPEQRETGGDERAPLATLFSRPYVRLIALMIALTLIMSIIVDFQMKWAASEKSEAELARFFGAFYGWVGVAQILFQFLVVPQLLRRLGIINSLIVFPLIVGLLSVLLLAAAAWGYLGVGILGFSAAVNFARITLAETLDLPSKELLFLPLPTRIRVRAQPFMNGALAAATRGVAGLILLLLVTVRVGVERLSVLAAAGAAVIVILLLRLRPRYRETLAETLRSGEGAGLDLNQLSRRTAGEPVFEALLASDDEAVVKFTLRLLRDRSTERLTDTLRRLVEAEESSIVVEALGALGPDAAALMPRIRERLGDEREAVREAAVLAMGRVAGRAAGAELAGLLGSPDRRMEDAAILALSRYGGDREQARVTPRIEQLAARTEACSRERAARLVGAVARPGYGSVLKNLLSDRSPEVRVAAADAVGHCREAALIPEMLSRLDDTELRPAALRALAAMAPDQLAPLEAYITDETRPATNRRALLRVVSSIGGPDAARLLWDIVGTFHRDLMTAAAAADGLRELRVREGLFHLPLRGFKYRQRQLGDLISLLNRARGATGDQPFVAGIFAEHARAGVRLLLSMAALRHHARQMERVLFNLFADSSALRARAVELLDEVLPRAMTLEISALLGPLLDETPQYGETLSSEILEALSGGEPWIRAVTHFAVMRAQGDARRIPLTAEEQGMAGRLGMVSYLKGVPLFSGVPAHQLLTHVEIIEWVAKRAGTRLFAQGDDGDACFILTEGEAAVIVDGEEVARVGVGECLGEMSLLERAPRSATVEMVSDGRLMKIATDRFRELVTLEPEVARALLRTLDRRIRDTQRRIPRGAVTSEAPPPVIMSAVRRMTTPNLQHIIPTLSALCRVELFRELPLESLTRIAELVQEVSLGKDEVLFRQGDAGDAMYLIIAGGVEIIVDDTPVATLGPNAYTGEMALVGSRSRSATVRIVEETRLLRLWSDDFTQLLNTTPEVSRALLKALSARLRAVSQSSP